MASWSPSGPYAWASQPAAPSAAPSNWWDGVNDGLSRNSGLLLGLGSGLLSGNLSGIPQGVAQGAASDRSRNLQDAQLGLQAKQRNATAEWARKNGYGQYADEIESGAISGSDIFNLINKQTVVPFGASVVNGKAETVAGGNSDQYGGTGMDAQNWNLVIGAQKDPSRWADPQVQAAWAQVTQPKMTMQQTPQGLVQVMQPPNIPPGWGPPQPQAAPDATQPVAPQTGPTAAPQAPGGGLTTVGGVTVGKPLPGTAAPLTEVQSKDVYFASNAAGALPVLDKLGTSLTSLGQTVGGKMLGPTLGNYVKSADYQQAEQAGHVFINAIERKESGAAIGAAENETYGRTFLPQPGDKPAVLAQKAIARKNAIDALKAGMPPQAILALGQQMLADPSIAPTAAPAQGKVTDMGNGVTIEEVP